MAHKRFFITWTRSQDLSKLFDIYIFLFIFNISIHSFWYFLYHRSSVSPLFSRTPRCVEIYAAIKINETIQKQIKYDTALAVWTDQASPITRKVAAVIIHSLLSWNMAHLFATCTSRSNDFLFIWTKLSRYFYLFLSLSLCNDFP